MACKEANEKATLTVEDNLIISKFACDISIAFLPIAVRNLWCSIAITISVKFYSLLTRCQKGRTAVHVPHCDILHEDSLYVFILYRILHIFIHFSNLSI